MTEPTHTTRRYPDGWRVLPLQLSIAVAPSGLVTFGADEPRNLAVTGQTLQEAFEEFVIFIEECARIGKPFEVFDGVKLR